MMKIRASPQLSRLTYRMVEMGTLRRVGMRKCLSKDGDIQLYMHLLPNEKEIVLPTCSGLKIFSHDKY